MAWIKSGDKDTLNRPIILVNKVNKDKAKEILKAEGLLS